MSAEFQSIDGAVAKAADSSIGAFLMKTACQYDDLKIWGDYRAAICSTYPQYCKPREKSE